MTVPSFVNPTDASQGAGASSAAASLAAQAAAQQGAAAYAANQAALAQWTQQPSNGQGQYPWQYQGGQQYQQPQQISCGYSPQPCNGWTFGMYVYPGQAQFRLTPNLSLDVLTFAASLPTQFSGFQMGNYYFQPYNGQVAVYYCTQNAAYPGYPSSMAGLGAVVNSNLANAQSQLIAAVAAVQNAQTLPQYQQAIVQLNAIGPTAQAAANDATTLAAGGPNASAVATAVMQLTQASNALSNDLIQQNLATDVPTIQFVAQDAVKQATTAVQAASAALSSAGWGATAGAAAPSQAIVVSPATPIAPAPSSVVTNVTTAAPTSMFTPVVIGAIALGAAGAGYYLWRRYQSHQRMVNSPSYYAHKTPRNAQRIR